MALKIFWTERATEDIEELINYFEKYWTEGNIQAFFLRLEECLEKISEAPQWNKNSLRKQGVKEFQHSSKTTIFYSYDKQTVYILRIWSNQKNPQNL